MKSCVTLLLLSFTLASILPAPSAERLPREDLLLYRSKDGKVHRASTPTEWNARRETILEGMRSIMGSLPERTGEPIQWTQLKEEDAGTYWRRLITYASEPGMSVPAYLCVPKHLVEKGTRAPAVLCLHPTDNRVGHGVVVGLGGKPNRQYAAELAERGYVTLSPSYPLLALYQPNMSQSICDSGTLKAILDNRRGLDLLESLPFVDASHGFGAIGHSLGGHNAIYTAVLEPRITAVISSCGFDSYLDYYDGADAVWQPGKGWCQERYMARLAQYRGRLQDIPFDFHEMIGALAPRPFLAIAPKGDSNFRWQSVDRVIQSATQVYQLHGAIEAIQVLHPDCEHDFPEPLRQKAYDLLDNVLRPFGH